MNIQLSRLAPLIAVLVLSLSLTAWAQPTAMAARYTSSPITAYPPNISQGAGGPMMMLTASRDHTLFAPIYTDHEDIDSDGEVDHTFKPTFKYYGYFDSDKCYGYNASHPAGARFEPVLHREPVNGRRTCPAGRFLWSGNFLNWATMTRLDVVRKMLYGGHRIEDTLTDTTLQMAALAHDAHAFVKYYSGADIGDYTPFSAVDLQNAGLTLCSRGSARNGQGYPVLRMAKGNYSLWATTPGTVCNWSRGPGDFAFGAKAQAFYGKYGPLADPDPTKDPRAHRTKLPDEALDGARYGKLGPELAIRVQACAAAFAGQGSERCGSYQRSGSAAASTALRKPIGLLQEFATSEQKQQPVRAEFGLITGSFDENFRGGQLRKNVASFNDEIDVTSGRFCHLMPAADAQSPSSCNGVSSATFANGGGTERPGIVRAFDHLRLFSAENYNADAPSVPFPLPREVANGRYPSWGNPMSEMITQALAYFANLPMGGNTVGAGSRDAAVGLPVGISATDPLDDTTIDPVAGLSRQALHGRAICRPMHMLAISSGSVTHDTDEPGEAEDVYDTASAFLSRHGGGEGALRSLTNKIGEIENINSFWRSVGAANGGFGVDCTLKRIGTVLTQGLADVAGVCPEAPAVKGTYLGAGAAFGANTRAIRERANLNSANGSTILDSNLPAHALRVRSYAATLSGGVARIEVPIPGKPGKVVYITPESSWDFQGFDGKQTHGDLMPGAMLTFRAIHATASSAAYVVTWNDAQFGGDYDMDIVGFLRWEIKPSSARPGAYELMVMSDILNQEAGAPGAHGFSIMGAVSENLPTGFSPSARYLTHGGMNYAASSDCAALRASGSSDFNLRCSYSAAGMNMGNGGSDGFAWPTTYNGMPVGFYEGGLNPPLTSSVVKTFLVTDGVADVTLHDPLWYVAKYGSFDTGEKEFAWSSAAVPQGASGAKAVNWDGARNGGAACSTSGCADGEPDGYFLARRPELLEERLRSLLLTVIQASNSAPAVSSTQLIAGSLKYIAGFSQDGFGGTVKAYLMDTDGRFSSKPKWDASMNMADEGNRVVITDDGRSGLNFAWSSLNVDEQAAYRAALIRTGVSFPTTSAQLSALALQADRIESLVDYLRGVRTKEGASFRVRRDGVMGPIVNSTPWLQSPVVAARYTDMDFAVGTPSYRAFVNTTKGAARALLWVGSNDGMLHGIDALLGTPVMSYVPSPLVGRLEASLSASVREPVALMDGSPFTGDVLVASLPGFSPAGASLQWRTYLFSSLGRGGRALFALDVSDPSTLIAANTAPNAFKWVFSSQDDPDLGYQLQDPVRHPDSGQPSQIVYLNNGEFGLLVPNGHGSAQGRAALFILSVNGPSVPAATGSDRPQPIWSQETTSGVKASYRKILTSAEGNNGLMGATWVDLDNNGTADVVYASDLLGHMWKFDLRSANPAEWQSALLDEQNAPKPFFTATNGTRTLSITTAPVTFFPNFGGTMISFGTGRAIESPDFPDTSIKQRFFTVWDKGRYAGDRISPPIAAVAATANTPATDAVLNLLPSVTASRTVGAGANPRSVPTFIRRESRRDATTGAVYQIQVSATGEIVTRNGQEVRVEGNLSTQDFDPAVHDGWYMDFPTEGEAVINSPLRRLNFIVFTTVRPKSQAEREQSCSVGPDGTLYAFNPVNGLPIRNLLADGSMDMGVRIDGQEIALASLAGDDVSTGGKVRDVAFTSKPEGGTPLTSSASNLRLQWREITGMRTRSSKSSSGGTTQPSSTQTQSEAQQP